MQMKETIGKYIESFGWIKNPPDLGDVDAGLLEASGFEHSQIAQDFRALAAGLAVIESSEPHLTHGGQVDNISRYVAGTLRGDAGGTLVNVASTHAPAAAVDDVELAPEAQAFWHSGVLVELLADALPTKTKRAGHQIGCVQAFYDAADDQLEISVRLVRRGQCSLELTLAQPLASTSNPPHWLDELREASAAKARIDEEIGSTLPAEPDPDTEIGELAAAIAFAVDAGEDDFTGSAAAIAAELTRHELASALGRPISAIEVVYSGDQGSLLVWEPGVQIPRALVISS